LFNNSRQFQVQLKLKLWHHVIAAIIAVGSSHQVQDGVDEVISHPATLL
jgi:hypothetical protein